MKMNLGGRNDVREKNKPYTWEEIKEFLVKELKKTSHIMTFGTIGSCNVEHDVDIIITKKPLSSSVNFFKEVHSIFDKVGEYLNLRYGSKLIRLPGLSSQGELLNFVKVNKNDLIFHSMVYVSLPQIINEWLPWTEKGDDISRILKNNYSCLIGDVESLFKKDFSHKNYYDFIFTYLAHYDRINFPYPEEKLIKIMNKFYFYLFKKRLNLKPPVARNMKEVRKYFYQLCSKIDELEVKRK